ncbi:PDZ domain-containing protein [Candidatus Hydrogenedentota bacterium]
MTREEPNTKLWVVVVVITVLTASIAALKLKASAGTTSGRLPTETTGWRMQPGPSERIQIGQQAAFSPNCATCPNFSQCFPGTGQNGQQAAFSPNCATCPSFTQCFPNAGGGNTQPAAATNVQQTPNTGGMAAPPIPSGATAPVVIKEFGMEAISAGGGGIKVTGVMGLSHAQDAGLQFGDLITRFGDARVRDIKHFQQLVSQAAPEGNVNIKVLRKGKIRRFTIMVGEGEMEGVTPIPSRSTAVAQAAFSPNCATCPNFSQCFPNTSPTGQQAAFQNTTTGLAPEIFRDAAMPHAYRGVCSNCHVIRPDIAIGSSAQMPHQYRGVCSNCHVIMGTRAGVK